MKSPAVGQPDVIFKLDKASASQDDVLLICLTGGFGGIFQGDYRGASATK
jgi:hypothetical protein